MKCEYCTTKKCKECGTDITKPNETFKEFTIIYHDGGNLYERNACILKKGDKVLLTINSDTVSIGEFKPQKIITGELSRCPICGKEFTQHK